MRCSRGRVSLSPSVDSSPPMAATPVMAQNTLRQPARSISRLPASGARIGETLNTSISSPIMRVASCPV